MTRPPERLGVPGDAARRAARVLAAAAILLITGCPDTAVLELRKENSRLKEGVAERDRQIGALSAALEECNRQLRDARGISPETLDKIFYAESIVIDRLSGGEDYDGQPGDDGVTVYLQPVDRAGDALKVAGEARIELFDLGMPPGRNLIAAYSFPVEKVRESWYGKFWTYHYTFKCPWQHGPPENPEITVRATFVDYLTKRVMTAQTVVKVRLPPR